jgi:hypothetical protein
VLEAGPETVLGAVTPRLAQLLDHVPDVRQFMLQVVIDALLVASGPPHLVAQLRDFAAEALDLLAQLFEAVPNLAAAPVLARLIQFLADSPNLVSELFNLLAQLAFPVRAVRPASPSLSAKLKFPPQVINVLPQAPPRPIRPISF